MLTNLHLSSTEYEPFDDNLRVRVQELQDKIDKETTIVTHLRRTVPKQIATSVEEQLKSQIAHDLSLTDVKRDEKMGDIKWDIHELDRHQEVQEVWEKSMKQLAELKDVSVEYENAHVCYFFC